MLTCLACPCPLLQPWEGPARGRERAVVSGVVFNTQWIRGRKTDVGQHTTLSKSPQEENTYWKTARRFLKKLGIKLPYDPPSPLLGKNPEKTKIEKDTGTPMFTAALFTTARTRKQPSCLSTDEWIKKLWYICTMEYYSAIKRNTIESVVIRWMNREPITQKNKYHIVMHIIWNLERWY